jgi:murein L,D-transpeptidase YafK
VTNSGEILLAAILGSLWLSGLGAETKVDRIVVEKANRTLKLMCGEEVVKSYRIALGPQAKGHKQCQGDNRTPQGRYIIDSRNVNSRYHRALHISYPNNADVQAAKKRGCDPGGAIMIHGLPNGQGWIGHAHTALDWTQGCIAVTNEEIEEIWRLAPDGTPVEIKP